MRTAREESNFLTATWLFLAAVVVVFVELELLVDVDTNSVVVIVVETFRVVSLMNLVLVVLTYFSVVFTGFVVVFVDTIGVVSITSHGNGNVPPLQSLQLQQ
jgi:hypothetical protein